MIVTVITKIRVQLSTVDSIETIKPTFTLKENNCVWNDDDRSNRKLSLFVYRRNGTEVRICLLQKKWKGVYVFYNFHRLACISAVDGILVREPPGKHMSEGLFLLPTHNVRNVRMLQNHRLNKCLWEMKTLSHVQVFRFLLLPTPSTARFHNTDKTTHICICKNRICWLSWLKIKLKFS